MRKFFSDKAGATFNFEMPTFTYAVRKNCIELIYKLNRGCYAILNLQRAAKNQLVLTANWHHYFNRIQNPAVQYPKIEKCCPKLYTILKGDDPDGVMQVESTDEDGTKIYGFGMLIRRSTRRIPAPCIDETSWKPAAPLSTRSLPSTANSITPLPSPHGRPGWKRSGIDIQPQTSQTIRRPLCK
jgi:hypothetical protein